MALELDARAHTAAARDLLAFEGVGMAEAVLASARGREGFRAALALEIRRLPAGEPNRGETLRRWRAEARE